MKCCNCQFFRATIVALSSAMLRWVRSMSIADNSFTYYTPIVRWHLVRVTAFLNFILVVSGHSHSPCPGITMRLISALCAGKKSSYRVIRYAAKPSEKTTPQNNLPISAARPSQTHSNAGKQQQTAAGERQPDQNGGATDGQSMYRENEMRIQMLSKPLYDQVFKSGSKKVHDAQTIQR